MGVQLLWFPESARWGRVVLGVLLDDLSSRDRIENLRITDRAEWLVEHLPFGMTGVQDSVGFEAVPDGGEGNQAA
jgi:hypothetical protein